MVGAAGKQGEAVLRHQFEEKFTPEVLADHITRFSIAAIRAYDSIDSYSET